jgi:hypothetical protein
MRFAFASLASEPLMTGTQVLAERLRLLDQLLALGALGTDPQRLDAVLLTDCRRS